MMKEAENFILKQLTGTQQDPRLLVAYSAGADSTALLHFVVTLGKTHSFPVAAIHLNHNDRGRESDEDEIFCRDSAKRYGIDIFIDKLPEGTKIDELTTRELRYAFFKETCLKHNFSFVLTAHTLSDDIETVLYRIIKGTGICGLQAIPSVRELDPSVTVIRPFLTYKKEVLLTYCKQHQLDYREDSLNHSSIFLRNRIRHDLLPSLKDYNPKIEQAIIQLKNIAKITENIVDEYVLPIYQQIGSPHILKLPEYNQLSEPVKVRIIQLFLTEHLKKSPDYKTIEKVKNYISLAPQLKCGKKFSLTSNRFLFVNQHTVEIIEQKDQHRIHEEYDLKIPGEMRCTTFNLAVRVSPYTDPIKSFPSSHAYESIVNFNKNIMENQMKVRFRQEGDIIQPLGMTGSMKLKKWFINKFIPAHVRDTIPLIVQNNEVLWAVGVGLSDCIKVVDNPSHRIEVYRI